MSNPDQDEEHPPSPPALSDEQIVESLIGAESKSLDGDLEGRLGDLIGGDEEE